MKISMLCRVISGGMEVIMPVKQISVFLENKSGRLAEVTSILGDNQIDISALSIADTADFGILRLIVSDPVKAEQILKDSGFTVAISSVLAIGIEDTPGSLAKVLNLLREKDMPVEYIYAFVGRHSGKALVIIRVENAEETGEMLSANNVEVIACEDVYRL